MPHASLIIEVIMTTALIRSRGFIQPFVSGGVWNCREGGRSSGRRPRVEARSEGLSPSQGVGPVRGCNPRPGKVLKFDKQFGAIWCIWAINWNEIRKKIRTIPNSRKILRNGFYRAMHFSAKRGIAIACRLSVTLVNCDHIGWNSSKIISPLISTGRSLFATLTWRVCSKGITP